MRNHRPAPLHPPCPYTTRVRLPQRTQIAPLWPSIPPYRSSGHDHAVRRCRDNRNAPNIENYSLQFSSHPARLAQFLLDELNSPNTATHTPLHDWNRAETIPSNLEVGRFVKTTSNLLNRPVHNPYNPSSIDRYHPAIELIHEHLQPSHLLSAKASRIQVCTSTIHEQLQHLRSPFILYPEPVELFLHTLKQYTRNQFASPASPALFLSCPWPLGLFPPHLCVSLEDLSLFVKTLLVVKPL